MVGVKVGVGVLVGVGVIVAVGVKVGVRVGVGVGVGIIALTRPAAQLARIPRKMIPIRMMPILIQVRYIW